MQNPRDWSGMDLFQSEPALCPELFNVALLGTGRPE